MNIESNKSLGKFNSLGFDEVAEFYVEVGNDQELLEALEHADRHQLPVFILGGGSNIVLTQGIRGLVVRLTNNDVQYVENTDPNQQVVTAGAGTNWHQLVLNTLAQGYHGLENLSLIPGTVGAAPVQNIGAYGVELKDRFVALRACHRPTRTFHTLHADDCQFGYRDSLFKHRPNEYIITEVTLDISSSLPLVTHYASLAAQLADVPEHDITASLISDIVCRVRSSRLPDPAIVGNAGSFFHNPVVSNQQFAELQNEFPRIVGYPQNDGNTKLAAGWLIDHLGYRAHRYQGVGVHDKQALVLVNTGEGTGRELLDLAATIQQHVFDTFAVRLNIEPLVI